MNVPSPEHEFRTETKEPKICTRNTINYGNMK